MAAVQNRFLHLQQPPAPRRKRWGSCWGGLSFFRKQKGGGKRIVPASRIPETNALSNQPNGPQAVGGLLNQTTGIALSLLAPPSSPASFSNSALQSTAQSPTCFLSANSPPSTMFVAGPYANETQLVSPPVFSTFTTEPSTAPLTPPPELAHLTTPSSPDVPYAHFLSSSAKIKGTSPNDLQSTYSYSLYPGSPASALRSPVDRLSLSFTEREFPPQWDPPIPSQENAYTKKSRQDSNFFCPETFAQFYLDQSSFSNAGGRLSISRESDAYTNGGNAYQNRQSKSSKTDAEELEAYRASFGFSADEIVTTANYVEISDVSEDSFSITPLASSVPVGEDHIFTQVGEKGDDAEKMQQDFSSSPQLRRAGLNRSNSVHFGLPVSYNGSQDQVPVKRFGISGRNFHNNHIMSDDDIIFSKGTCRINRKHHFGSSNSDAEIEYRRGSSLRERRNWRES